MDRDGFSRPASLDSAELHEMRQLARGAFLHALERSTIESAFDHHLHYERGILQVGEDLYDLPAFSRIFVVSIGKAANTAVDSLMKRLGGGLGVTGIVCGPTDPGTQVAGFRYYTGGHPVPNSESVKAAEAILRSLDALPDAALAIFLISGGGSSLVEKPIDDAISFEDLLQTYRALVHSGAPIAEINAVRKHLSAAKGGRMALAAAPAHQLSVLISDVPDNTPDSLASGPTMPDHSTIEQCYEVVSKYKLMTALPQSVRELFEHHAIPETPKEGDPAFARSRWWTVLSNSSARKSAEEWAAAAGFHVVIDNRCDDWDYRDAADYLLGRVRDLRQSDGRVCLISGGEVTVTVDGQAGIGGRNQQFALYCATKISGENITVLSAGTDGIDGNSPAAGAVVDGTTMERAAGKLLDVSAALSGFNAFPLFQSLDEAIVTGPTGNNVRDLRVLLAY